MVHNLLWHADIMAYKRSRLFLQSFDCYQVSIASIRLISELISSLVSRWRRSNECQRFHLKEYWKKDEKWRRTSLWTNCPPSPFGHIYFFGIWCGHATRSELPGELIVELDCRFCRVLASYHIHMQRFNLSPACINRCELSVRICVFLMR